MRFKGKKSKCGGWGKFEKEKQKSPSAVCVCVACNVRICMGVCVFFFAMIFFQIHSALSLSLTVEE